VEFAVDPPPQSERRMQQFACIVAKRLTGV
jgi:hypothetical protein